MLQETATLIDLCEGPYFRLNLRIRHEHTRQQYRFALANFREFLGCEPCIVHLEDDNVAGMMRMLMDRGLAPKTINGRRDRVHCIWVWLAKRGDISRWPTTPPLPLPVKIPRAWTREQLGSLVEACRTSPGWIGPVEASAFWIGWHAIQWDTGARTGEMLNLRWDWLDSEHGILHVPAAARKGARLDAVYQLRAETVQLLQPLRNKSPLIFFWPLHRTSFWNHYERLLKRAGLPFDRNCKPQKMRRSFASWLDALGGKATFALQHSSDSVTRKHYLDPSICDTPHADLLFSIVEKPENLH